VYSREIDDQILTIAASGWTYRNTFVLYDHETESIWYHLEGTNALTCISGAFADRTLDELSSFFGRWTNWRADNPDTKMMKSP